MSEQTLDIELERELRVDYLDYIIKHKHYKATKAQFKDWSTNALREEFDRISMMNNNPLIKKTTPNWKKSKQFDPNNALRVKRMRGELVAADYGSARSIVRWLKQNVKETYRKLKEHRKKDPKVPQKTVCPQTTAGRPQQTQTSKKLILSSALPTTALNQLKRQRGTDKEDEKKFEEIRKEGIGCRIVFQMDGAADQLSAELAKLLNSWLADLIHQTQ
ncbi:hypothetical protein Hanom_Chr16g01470951 [Helianthus anomalus]